MDFIEACKKGNFDEAKKIYDSSEKIRGEYYISAFKWCCYNGHLEIAKWLSSNDEISMYDKNDVFKYTCFFGQFEIAKWLYLEYTINIHDENDWAFTWCCHRDNIDIVEWLLGLDKFANSLINKILIQKNNDSKLIKIFFDRYYLANNKGINLLFQNYKENLIKNLNSVINDEYLIHDLWLIVYDYF